MKGLIEVQSKLKAGKTQRNSFGNYNYRSAEDILEAVKPLLHEHGLQLTLTDEIRLIGDRFYVMATATITDGVETVTVSAYAREAPSKKGMDESQVTGTASSYARKYSLNGLFLIDDSKDADTDEYQRQTREKEVPDKLKDARQAIMNLATEKGLSVSEVAKDYKINDKTPLAELRKIYKDIKEN